MPNLHYDNIQLVLWLLLLPGRVIVSPLWERRGGSEDDEGDMLEQKEVEVVDSSRDCCFRRHSSEDSLMVAEIVIGSRIDNDSLPHIRHH